MRQGMKRAGSAEFLGHHGTVRDQRYLIVDSRGVFQYFAKRETDAGLHGQALEMDLR